MIVRLINYLAKLKSLLHIMWFTLCYPFMMMCFCVTALELIIRKVQFKEPDTNLYTDSVEVISS